MKMAIFDKITIARGQTLGIYERYMDIMNVTLTFHFCLFISSL